MIPKHEQNNEKNKEINIKKMLMTKKHLTNLYLRIQQLKLIDNPKKSMK
jgi:hypothetical protein